MSSALDPVALTQALIRRPSVTPEDAGALDLVERALIEAGFRTERMRFAEEGTDAVDNLYARWGTKGRNFCFAGHTDVVPPGREADWSVPPFEGRLKDGEVWGRGAADMKGAIAAFIAAARRVISDGAANGASISLLITGDEEGPAVNGTKKVLDRLKARGERIDHCLVGEPSSAKRLGDTMKVGRRGSLNAWLTVKGRQGHVAYPDRALNPVHALVDLIAALNRAPLDRGYERFEASSLQVTDIAVGNPATNVIPARATARFNVRFNPNWTGAGLERHLRERLDAARGQADYELKVVVSGEAFLTTDAAFLDLVAGAVRRLAGIAPEHSTTGGTSDARFIKEHAPVCEFGLVNATIHQIDERVAVADILRLADIYEAILKDYFASGLAR
jgi:succinyl-diaminopimelate desuccinylase